MYDNVADQAALGPWERYEAVARSVRDVLSQRWVLTEKTYERENPKRVYYLSMEFLIGRSLSNNILNLLLDPAIERAAADKDLDWLAVLEQEPDAGLGNGGLGRLAACFIDSMATMQLPAMGYGLRYEYGIFKQTIQDGWQVEQPDNWLRRPDPWEIARPGETVEVQLGCSFEVRGGSLGVVVGRPSSLLGIPYDRPVVGYGGKTVNTLRLWAAAAPDYFDFRAFSAGEFVSALAERLTAESLTRVLYPDDSTSMGQGLRFVQEYFLVACSLADLVRRFRRHDSDWTALPAKVAIQLNDTHPSLAVPELMRILLDEAQLGWDQAWGLTRQTLAYTNHTLLPEALEKWPLPWFALLLPRHLEIILEINRRLVDEVRTRFPGDDGRVERVALIEEGSERRIRMANLAIVGTHSTNGVASIHSELLRTVTVKDLTETFPERFSNKTNGVTPRRWLLLANPHLAHSITRAIGDGWITDLDELARLRPLADDKGFGDAVSAAKREAKTQFANWLKLTSGVTVDPDTIFDCQIKRIHEYKRQLLNALRVVVLYDRLRQNPDLEMAPRTFFFAGKAAPAYHLAKIIIKFLNSLAGTIDGDPAVRGRLKVVFLPEYCVSLAERLIPATDVSNQISTAGYEASGTSNMKFMMNGALTIGTRDGATIEMAEAAGEENFFMFGLTAEQVAGSRSWYSPQWHYDNEPETRAALDLIFSDHFSRYEPGIFEPLRQTLLTGGDNYMHLADLTAYLEADRRLLELYADPMGWARKVILNVAGSGRFSSDRTIGEYAAEIWDVKPCPVP
ncbi:glycogen phosphorylase [Skermanella stibiiresistens SB22]|uniref:Alpha-1,4 glucan phosphorylase n=2 Tax=Skermanella TaxID=204447 RepID=W9GUJ6_9PROT|nr:glycogen phosphorylase [Skermanella stibiiresistens SB22]